MIIENVLFAFGEVFHWKNLGLMFLGTTAGLIAGSIPGFTIAMAVVLTLPFTFGMSPVEGLSTMIGVFVGGLSGGLSGGRGQPLQNLALARFPSKTLTSQTPGSTFPSFW